MSDKQANKQRKLSERQAFDDLFRIGEVLRSPITGKTVGFTREERIKIIREQAKDYESFALIALDITKERLSEIVEQVVRKQK